MKAERDAQLRCQQAEQEERLATEMERIRLETDRDERIRRQVRENSLELRELETKLRDAYAGAAAFDTIYLNTFSRKPGFREHVRPSFRSSFHRKWAQMRRRTTYFVLN